jgi:hypothetical protein
MPRLRASRGPGPDLGEFGDGGAGAGFVDDGFAVGEGGEEGVDGDVVDDAGVAAAGLVDEGDGVVGEQCVAAADELRWWWM